MPSYRVDFVRSLEHLCEDYLSLASPEYIDQGMNGENYEVHLELDLGDDSPIDTRKMSVVGVSDVSAVKARDKAASEGFKILQRLYNVELDDFRYALECTHRGREALLNHVNALRDEESRVYQNLLQSRENLMNFLRFQ